jgi:hypothetical protein
MYFSLNYFMSEKLSLGSTVSSLIPYFIDDVLSLSLKSQVKVRVCTLRFHHISDLFVSSIYVLRASWGYFSSLSFK